MDNHRLAKDLLLTLPVGISFYTFQSISYVIDVYRGKSEAEPHLGRYATFVAFFPQMVAGPIERFSQLNFQLKEKHSIIYENLSNGFRLMLYGFFVKMAVADNLSWYIDKIYENPARWSSPSVMLGCVFFSFQIYADFLGYTLIAQGTARLFGIKLIDNFRTPYSASSITVFWQRWHISLTSWFRDYVYIPLGGNRVNLMRWCINILIVFLLSGLWHGANYTFIIWGGIHGLFYLIERFTKSRFILSEKFPMLGAAKTFIVVTIAWIFFRASDLEQVKAIFNAIFNPAEGAKFLPVFEPKMLVLLAFFIFTDLLLSRSRFDHYCETLHPVKRWIVYGFMIFSILALSGTTAHPFIYFRF
ncbi:MAG: MBOAT family protein [Bacteroidia bacterium]|nr:MBOAT family protein [Bacteroidia bacterium]